MTTPTPYTDDNVKRLAEWAHLPGVTNVSEDRQVALNLLRRGVTLPPELERLTAENALLREEVAIADRRPAVPQDDGPTEPLFTGKLIGHSEYAGGGCEVVLDLPDWPGDDALRVTREVDVWPAGVRPAAPTVTASDIAVAVETAAIAPGRTWSIPVGGFDGLAEQGGEG